MLLTKKLMVVSVVTLDLHWSRLAQDSKHVRNVLMAAKNARSLMIVMSAGPASTKNQRKTLLTLKRVEDSNVNVVTPLVGPALREIIVTLVSLVCSNLLINLLNVSNVSNIVKFVTTRLLVLNVEVCTQLLMTRQLVWTEKVIILNSLLCTQP